MTGAAVSDSAATFTFLFTDLEGSTRLWEKFPRAMKGALGRHDAILRRAIEASGGRVVKSTGDGTMAVFASAVDAVAASLAAQRGLAGEPWPETGPLRVRMGIHSGLAEVRGDDFFGPTVNRTARLMAAGHGGQVLLSAASAALAVEQMPAGGSLLNLGEHRLKDLSRPENVFQLIHPDLPSAFPPLVTLDAAGISLPARATAFIGRRAELEQLDERLRDTSIRLLTLVGPGGTGKTTLAIRAAGEAASAFPDGVAFVDLAGAHDVDGVSTAIARAVGVGEVADRPLQEELVKRLKDRRMLLVLDNFEQVTEAAGLVARLLAECPHLRLLATSREALHLRAEHVFPLPPMALPPAGRRQVSAGEVETYEAAQLFVDRAIAIRPDFRLTDGNAATIAEICRRLDGLPLAIELAAARLRLFSPEKLLAQLGDRLKALRSGPRDLPERQQTLRATMDWSYGLLNSDEQRLFELLAVFAEADIADIEAVASEVGAVEAGEVDVLDALASLVEKSLLRHVDLAGAAPRVSMFETMREFAADRLGQHPDFAARARRVHAGHYAELALRIRPDLTGGRRTDALAALAAEIGNLRKAWDYWVAAADLEHLEMLADSLLILHDARSWYLDTVRIATDLLAVLAKHASGADRAGQEIALRVSLARALMTTKGFTKEVEDAYAGAIELFERRTDGRQQFPVLRGLANLYALRGDAGKAMVLGTRLLALGERESDTRMLVEGHLAVGSTNAFVDDLEAGLEHLDKAIAAFAARPPAVYDHQFGNDPRVACYTTSAFTLWLLGYPDRAVGRADAAIALAAELDHPFTRAFAYFHSGLLHHWRREADVVFARATALLDIAEEYGLQIWRAVGTCLIGAAQSDQGRVEEGLASILAGLDLYRGLRSPPVFWPMLLSIEAGARLRAGRPEEGLGPIDAAIRMMGAGPGGSVLPDCLIVKGDLLAALGAAGGDGGAEARQWYRQAFDRAAALKARMPQLRAATRLARSVPAGPEGEAARDALAAVYATFTEGFATRDLAEARDLLAAVAPARS